jgi:hypothetical protein
MRLLATSMPSKDNHSRYKEATLSSYEDTTPARQEETITSRHREDVMGIASNSPYDTSIRS